MQKWKLLLPWRWLWGDYNHVPELFDQRNRFMDEVLSIYI
jgi:hypothetical protein